MPNSFFSFKQFTINQGDCAMKVTTDSCLFGAWVSQYGSAGKVLDIGTGTGLLSLMYAQQKSLTVIDGVELDADAAKQASENVASSPWPNAIAITHHNIINFKPAYHYDTIISNPPFYQQQLISSNEKKNTAHHSSHLSLPELFQNVDRLLKSDGYFFVLQPWSRTDEAITTAESFFLFPITIVRVKQTPQHQYFRTMLQFSRTKGTAIKEQEIIIEIERGKYSEAFIELLKYYYLYL